MLLRLLQTPRTRSPRPSAPAKTATPQAMGTSASTPTRRGQISPGKTGHAEQVLIEMDSPVLSLYLGTGKTVQLNFLTKTPADKAVFSCVTYTYIDLSLRQLRRMFTCGLTQILPRHK